MRYDEYQHLLFKRHDDGVLQVTINRPEAYNAANARLHWELGQLWKDIGEDDQTLVVLITGAGKAFSSGGDFEMIDATLGNAELIGRMWKEAGDLVYNMVNMDKPVVSAINGVAVGAGLVVALLADVSIAAEDIRLTDGHLRLGVAAGDHAVILWPLLCGMAKAKYYLLTSEFIDGKEAERIGLVSMCVPGAQLMERAFDVAHRLAQGPQQAIRFTKRSLNNWLRMAGPAFDASLAMEMLGFISPDIKEGLTALKGKRAARFPSTIKR